jgi:3-oxoadipyl-CoA thiolase
MGKAESAFGRAQKLQDTTMGWRFVNPALEALYGTETMPRTGENVAKDFGISRADQDAFALRSQDRAATAQESGFFAEEIVATPVPGRRSGDIM